MATADANGAIAHPEVDRRSRSLSNGKRTIEAFRRAAAAMEVTIPAIRTPAAMKTQTTAKIKARNREYLPGTVRRHCPRQLRRSRHRRRPRRFQQYHLPKRIPKRTWGHRPTTNCRHWSMQQLCESPKVDRTTKVFVEYRLPFRSTLPACCKRSLPERRCSEVLETLRKEPRPINRTLTTKSRLNLRCQALALTQRHPVAVPSTAYLLKPTQRRL